MTHITEQFELLKSVVAVAAADGVITRSELGLIAAIGRRIGLGRRALEALVGRAAAHGRMQEELGRYGIGDREAAMELLVGAARIDGEVADEERDQLAIIAGKLGIEPERFEALYARGITRADRLRAMREPDVPGDP
ncbi:MAG: hypothetical protein ACYTGC_13345 [Planctomycetota bacterium]|jgi:tellurite resistance protein